MNGPKPQRTLIQPRDVRLLAEVAAMRVADRDQIMAAAGFGSVTRANERLLRLTQIGALKRIFLGSGLGTRKAIYSLTAAGAALANVPFQRLKHPNGQELAFDFFLEHQLRVNALYVLAKHRPTPRSDVRFMRWMTPTVSLAPFAPVIPDATIIFSSESGPKQVFVEVDLGTETSRVWQKKVDAYVALAASGEAVRYTGHSQFRVIVITTTDKRLETIRSVIASRTSKLFFLTTFERINREGLWSPIWLRPEGEERQAFV